MMSPVNPLHYFYRHLMWISVGMVVMISASMLPRRAGPSLAVGLALASGVCLILVPLVGTQINGATRWLGVPPCASSHPNSSSRSM